MVRIDVFADRAVPPVYTDDLEESDPQATLDALLKQMATISADELQDGVHRRFEYKLCGRCHKEFLSNPMGMPRRDSPTGNAVADWPHSVASAGYTSWSR